MVQSICRSVPTSFTVMKNVAVKLIFRRRGRTKSWWLMSSSSKVSTTFFRKTASASPLSRPGGVICREPFERDSFKAVIRKVFHLLREIFARHGEIVARNVFRGVEVVIEEQRYSSCVRHDRIPSPSGRSPLSTAGSSHENHLSNEDRGSEPKLRKVYAARHGPAAHVETVPGDRIRAGEHFGALEHGDRAPRHVVDREGYGRSSSRPGAGGADGEPKRRRGIKGIRVVLLEPRGERGRCRVRDRVDLPHGEIAPGACISQRIEGPHVIDEAPDLDGPAAERRRAEIRRDHGASLAARHGTDEIDVDAFAVRRTVGDRESAGQ